MSAPVILRSLVPLRKAVSHSSKLFSNTSVTRRLSSPIQKKLFSQSAFFQEKKYTEQHEWIELAEDGTTATIGITDYAAKALGDVVFVELPAIDSEFSAGDTIGAVESVKSASDIISPVKCTILEANMSLEEKPKIINESPEGKGWIARVRVGDASELDSLMDAKEYKASLGEEK
ncbi:hypothetical protein VTO42DRAFT_1421 [Malbranchea cinnamomea]